MTSGDRCQKEAIRGCTELDLSAVRAPVLYFLFVGEELVYIGQTINLAARLQWHLRDCRGTKVFDRVLYRRVPRAEIDAEERKWIEALKPKHNRLHNPQFVYAGA